MKLFPLSWSLSVDITIWRALLVWKSRLYRTSKWTLNSYWFSITEGHFLSVWHLMWLGESLVSSDSRFRCSLCSWAASAYSLCETTLQEGSQYPPADQYSHPVLWIPFHTVPAVIWVTISVHNYIYAGFVNMVNLCLNSECWYNQVPKTW